MIRIEMSDEYAKWFKKLRDHEARARIITRLKRIEIGSNFGDCEPVGEGVSELRFHFGKGYRVYLAQRGETVVVLLAGGTKATQKKDIQRAKELAQNL